jgi:hypothetical protein
MYAHLQRNEGCLCFLMPDRPGALISVGVCMARCIHLPVILLSLEVYRACEAGSLFKL